MRLDPVLGARLRRLAHANLVHRLMVETDAQAVVVIGIVTHYRAILPGFLAGRLLGFGSFHVTELHGTILPTGPTSFAAALAACASA